MKKILIILLTMVLLLISTAWASQYVPSPSIEMITDYVILVNKQNKLPSTWEKYVDLVEVEDFEGGHPHQVEREALAKFYELREALLAEGIQIELDSCYRSVEAQQDIWDRFTEEYGEEYVKTYVAVPGYSEHHTGLAIDICLVKDGVTIDENDDMIAEKEIFEKIHAKLADYGFILRYPEGKEEITGYGYEPWHFRYVGDPVTAHEIMDNGYTLEEFLEIYQPNAYNY
jgi:D-alanyl-D-alanine carboxypeptidase